MGSLATSGYESEFVEYEKERVREGTELFLRIQPIYACVLIAVHIRELSNASDHSVLLIALNAIFAGIALTMGFWGPLRRWILGSTARSAFLQTAFFMSALGMRVQSAINFRGGDAVTQHRWFLVPSFGLYVFCSYGLFVPALIQNYFYPSWYFVCFLAFHASVGYLNFQPVVTGLVIAGMVLYFSRDRRRTDFKLFRTLAALHKSEEHTKHLIAAQQGMLRTIFDASCTCCQSGFIKESTPQMRDILGDVQGLLFSDLASSGYEKTRISDFLKRIQEDSTSMALTLQTCLLTRSSATLRSQENGEGKRTIELQLFGIKCSGGKDSNADGGDVSFLGIRRLATHVGSRDAGPLIHAMAFDADTPLFNIVDSHISWHEIMDGGAVVCSSLAQMVPECHKRFFEDWICDEVQDAPDDTPSLSMTHLSNLPLQITGLFIASRAWLHINCQHGARLAASIPVTLRVEGLRTFRQEDANAQLMRHADRLPTVVESEVSSERSTLESFVSPSDSVSQTALRRRDFKFAHSDPGCLWYILKKDSWFHSMKGSTAQSTLWKRSFLALFNAPSCSVGTLSSPSLAA